MFVQRFNFTSDTNIKLFKELLEYLESICLCKLEIKETRETISSAYYLDCYLYLDNVKLVTRLYDKLCDFDVLLVDFPFQSSNIPSEPACVVNVSQFICYTGVSLQHQYCIEPGKLLINRQLT